MDSWENIILKWINCLYNSSHCIKTIEDLQDGKIYYSLINRIVSLSSKKINKNERDVVLEFLKDEYPNFPFKNESSAISKLSIASLILARLSLEPIFHKMCMSLDVDIQITIKSILETVYSLDKTITEQDFYNIFLLSSKKDLKLLDTKTKFIQDEFVEIPSSVDDISIEYDDMQSQQTKQIRQLKVQVETMGYENSDLLADIAARDSQINDLQNKLHEALSELKMVRADSFKLNNNFVEPKGKKEVDSVCRKQYENLEKYVHKLETDNKLLQDKRETLTNEVKELYLEKLQVLKDKNGNKKKAIELEVLTKSQERQIKDLQNKLRVTSPKIYNSPFPMGAKGRNALETAYFTKIKGLEKTIMKLKSKNYYLEREKQALVVEELKLYKQKHYILKEKIENKKKAFESVMLIKSQQKQILDLQNKLITSEKSIAKLRAKNYELFQEKRTLVDELKSYKGKQHGILRDKIENKKK